MPDTQQQLIYIANARMPTEKAHGIQIAHMCEALGRTMSVTLVLPERANTIQEDLCSFYQIERTFSVRLIRCIDLLEQKWVPKRLAYWLEAITFSIHVAKYIRSLPSHSLLYTRDLFSLVLVSPRRPVVYEIHSLPKKHTRFFGWLLQKTARIVAISHGLERELVARGYPADRIVVAPDAVDVQDFTVDTTQQSCRKKIHLPEGKKIAMYTGHLYAWKGVATVLEAARALPEVLFVFVGGTDDDRQTFSAAAASDANVLVLGHRPHHQIKWYLRSADVLLLPNSAKEKISSHYTSPMKLFEYMAAGRPVLASDLPSLREILDETLATFFTPDNTTSFIQQMRYILSHSDEVGAKAIRARDVVHKYSWHARADRITAVVSELSS